MRTQIKLALIYGFLSIVIVTLFGTAIYYFLDEYSYVDFYKRLQARVSISAQYNLNADKLSNAYLKTLKSQHLEKLEKEKADKLEKAKEAKEKAAEEKAEKELSDKKAAAEKAAKAKKAAEEKKAADKARAAEMSRITGAAGAGTTGTAEKSTAPRKDSGYVAALTSKIKSNIAYSGSTDVPGNPRAVFKIEQLPTGEIISVRKIKSSGLPAYDSSVENAINKSSPLPKKKDGTVEREIELIFEMKDLPK